MPNPFTSDDSHDLFDKHLIYFKSDFDISNTRIGTVKTKHNLGNGQSIIRTHKRTINSGAGSSNSKRGGMISSAMTNANGETMISLENSRFKNKNDEPRRLAAYNNGDNEAEICVYFDPYIYEKYESRYGDNYLNHMSYAAAGMISTSSQTFSDTNWGNNIGNIKLKLKSVRAITAFSGDYKSIEPDWITYEGESGLYISSDDYLDKLSDWARSNIDWNNCDNVKLYTVEDLDAGGIANVGGMCKTDTGESATMTVDYYPYGYTDMEWSTDTTEHELGMFKFILYTIVVSYYLPLNLRLVHFR